MLNQLTIRRAELLQAMHQSQPSLFEFISTGERFLGDDFQKLLTELQPLSPLPAAVLHDFKGRNLRDPGEKIRPQLKLGELAPGDEIGFLQNLLGVDRMCHLHENVQVQAALMPGK